MTQPRQPGDQAKTATAAQITVVGCVQREADYRKAHDAGRGGTMGTGAGVGNEFVLINVTPASQMSSTESTPGAAGTTAGVTGTTTGSATGTSSGATGTTGTTTGTTAGTTTGTTAGTTTGTTAGTTAGTSSTGYSSMPGSSSIGSAYQLTGNREKELEKFVGQRVEIVGSVENAGRTRTGASGTGAYSGTSPTGTAGTGTTSSTGAETTGTTSGTARTGASFSDLPKIDVVSFRMVEGSCPP